MIDSIACPVYNGPNFLMDIDFLDAVRLPGEIKRMATDIRLKESLPALTERIVETYEECGGINHLGHSPLPSYREIVEILGRPPRDPLPRLRPAAEPAHGQRRLPRRRPDRQPARPPDRSRSPAPCGTTARRGTWRPTSRPRPS